MQNRGKKLTYFVIASDWEGDGQTVRILTHEHERRLRLPIRILRGVGVWWLVCGRGSVWW